jgi:hypothetical protein
LETLYKRERGLSMRQCGFLQYYILPDLGMAQALLR